MDNPIISFTFCLLLGLAMVATTALAHRRARRKLQAPHEKEAVGTGSVDGAVFALLGLLIAFTFSLAYSRFEMRRELIVSEVNAIGTAYLRLELLPVQPREALKKLFSEYVSLRIGLWDALSDRPRAVEIVKKTEAHQLEIWSAAVSATSVPEYHAVRMLLLPAINEMIDITTSRLVAIQAHPPLMINGMLFLTALVCAAFSGTAMGANRSVSWLHAGGFAFLVSSAIFLILDIEYPRQGFITLNENVTLFAALEESMK